MPWSTWFRSAPRYAEVRIPQAVVLTPEKFGVNFTERIEGATWSGQSRSFYIYPRKAGAYTVPPVSVTFTYALAGAKPSDEVTLQSPELKFEARLPPGAENVPAFVATSGFSVKGSFD